MSAGNKEEREQLNLNVKKSGEQFRVILKVLLALLAVIILTAAVVLIRGHLIEVCYYSVPAHSSGKVRIAALAIWEPYSLRMKHCGSVSIMAV